MLPALPIPEPLRGAEIGTFAHNTVTKRIPEIARRTIAEGDFAPEIGSRLKTLAEDLPHGKIRLLQDPGAPDLADWQSYIQPYEGQTWLEVPWFFAETYFYRRILEASGYFQPGPGYGADPYAYQKGQGLLQARQALESLEPELASIKLEYPVDLERLLYLDLWGNQADLSMWPAGGEKETPSVGKDEHLLRNDITAIVTHLHHHPGRVDLILDNTGAELAFDFLLVDGLLRSGLADTVYLWVKPHPTFVSDVTAGDIQHALDDLAAYGSASVSAMVRRLSENLSEDRLRINVDYFWTSPLAGWDMPLATRQELSQATLILSKGDANYRRWLGDRHWVFNASIDAVLSYIPAPLGLLRVFKCEVAAGIPEDALVWVPKADPKWMVDGKWGMVQFLSG